jgi:putative NADH-flavin reductase
VHIALFGATGGTGRAFLDQALEAGHTVAALARDPGALSPRAGLSIIAGDAREAGPVRETVRAANAVACILGGVNRKPNTDVSDATARVIEGMQAENVQRLAVISTIGAGDSFKPLKSPVFKLLIRTMLKNIWADRDRQEAIVKASALDWTIIRPGGLRDEPKTAQYQVVEGAAPQPPRVRIARADVAHLLLKTLSEPGWSRRTVCQFY